MACSCFIRTIIQQQQRKWLLDTQVALLSQRGRAIIIIIIKQENNEWRIVKD